MTVMQQLVEQADALLKSNASLEGWARKMKAEGGEHPFTWCVNKATFVDDPKAFCAKVHQIAFGKTPMQRKMAKKVAKAMVLTEELVKARGIKKRPKGWRPGKTPPFKEHPSVVRYRDPEVRTHMAVGKAVGHTHARFKANPMCCPECSRLDGTIRAINTVKGWTYSLPHPNCYTEGTEVYTDAGWLDFSELHGSERVLTLDPHRHNAEFLCPEEYIEYKHEGNVLRFANRSFDVETTPRHVHYVRPQCGIWHLTPASDITPTGYIFYRGLRWEGKDPEYVSVGHYHLPSSVYAWLAALFIAEGSVSIKDSDRYQISISQSRDAHSEYYDEILHGLQCFTPWKWWAGEQGFTSSAQDLAHHFMEFGHGAANKWIPNIIRSMTPDLIAEFLDTYAACDGHTRVGDCYGVPSTETSYHTASKRIADVIGELVLKSGGRPSFGIHTKAGTMVEHSNGTYTQNHDVLRISHCHHVHTSKYKIESRKYSGTVRCVQMPKWHVILVRRNGRIVWSGNCNCSWETGYMHNGKFTTERPMKLPTTSKSTVHYGLRKSYRPGSYRPVPIKMLVAVTDKHGHSVHRWKSDENVTKHETLVHHAKGGETKPRASSVGVKVPYTPSENWHMLIARDFMAKRTAASPEPQDAVAHVPTHVAIRRTLSPDQLSITHLSSMKDGDVIESHKGTTSVRVEKREGHYVVSGTGVTVPIWVLRADLAMHYLTGTLHAHAEHRKRLYQRLQAAGVDTKKSHEEMVLM